MEVKFSSEGYPPVTAFLEPSQIPPGLIWNVPSGYSIYQLGEDIDLYGKLRKEASDGCPAIFTVFDKPDSWFTEQWQYYMYAANKGMRKAAVAQLMGDTKFMMNDTGIGDKNEPRYNFIVDTPRETVIRNGQAKKAENPRLDKFRLMVRNSYAFRSYDRKYLMLWTMDGTKAPPMKTNPLTGMPYPRPKNIQEIDKGIVTIDHYMWTPREHLFAWNVCNNLKRKNGQINNSTISPFANGVKYPWTPSPNEMYTFFPNVSNQKIILVERKYLIKVAGDRYPNPYRREVRKTLLSKFLGLFER